MIAVSLRQPWAWLTVNGVRRAIPRAESTSHRGELLIHAGQQIDDQGWLWCRTHFPAVVDRIPPRTMLSRGGIVGRVQLVACLPAGSTWRWVVTAPETLPFHRCRGVPGLFTVSLGDAA